MTRPATPTRGFTYDRIRAEAVQRIVITGGESTGKTTLARALADALEVPLAREFAREYADRVARPLTSADVEPIAHGQVEREDAAIAFARRSVEFVHARRLVVLDTDLVSTTVYAEHYYGACPPWILDAARERRGHLYLLCPPDLPWVADGVRDQPSARERIHHRFASRLHEIGATVMEVRGAGDARLVRALAAVRGWRAASR